MITNKDIRVENGNLVLNGDKFPLDGQSPAAIMEIVEDNSDTTPTENSTAPITSGGVYTALGTKQDDLTFDTAPTENSVNPVTSGGVYTADKSISDTIGDITQTGVTGATVAAQITALDTAIGGLNYAVFSIPLTSVAVDKAWGNMYESNQLYIDITSLGLTVAPTAVFLGVVDTTGSIMFELSTTTNEAINFRLARATSATIASLTVKALVIY